MRTLLHAGLEDAASMRVYTLASDRVHGHDFATAIVRAARDAGLMGATVLPGFMGYGRRGFAGEPGAALAHPQHQPYVVEVVDRPKRLRRFLPLVQKLNRWDRLIILEGMRVYSYHYGPAGSGEVA